MENLSATKMFNVPNKHLLTSILIYFFFSMILEK